MFYCLEYRGPIRGYFVRRFRRKADRDKLVAESPARANEPGNCAPIPAHHKIVRRVKWRVPTDQQWAEGVQA